MHALLVGLPPTLCLLCLYCSCTATLRRGRLLGLLCQPCSSQQAQPTQPAAHQHSARGRCRRFRPTRCAGPSESRNYITPKGKTMSIQAINVRNQGFERLRQQGEAAVAPVQALLKDDGRVDGDQVPSAHLLEELQENADTETKR